MRYLTLPAIVLVTGLLFAAPPKVVEEFSGKVIGVTDVGSSRGGAVAMNINSGDAKLVLLCPAWKNWGTVETIRPDAVILHSRADDVIPFADSEELATISRATLIEIGSDYRLADPEPLAAMLNSCEVAG